MARGPDGAGRRLAGYGRGTPEQLKSEGQLARSEDLTPKPPALNRYLEISVDITGFSR